MTPKQTKKQKEILTTAHRDYEKGLNRHAFFKLNNHATSADLVQDTFMKTWKYLLRGGQIDLMKAFLYHVLNNLIVDEYRKRKHRTTSLDTLIEKGFEISIDDSRKLFDTLDGKAVLLLFENLPPSYHKMIHMRYIQDLSLEEISSLTKQSKNNVAVKIHRGLKKLKVLYDRT